MSIHVTGIDIDAHTNAETEHPLSSHLFGVTMGMCAPRYKLKWIKYGIVYCECLLDFEILMKQKCCRCCCRRADISDFHAYWTDCLHKFCVCYISISRRLCCSPIGWFEANMNGNLCFYFGIFTWNANFNYANLLNAQREKCEMESEIERWNRKAQNGGETNKKRAWEFIFARSLFPNFLLNLPAKLIFRRTLPNWFRASRIFDFVFNWNLECQCAKRRKIAIERKLKYSLPSQDL